MTATLPAAPEWVAVTDLRVGDLVDLEGDPYADPGHGNPDHHCGYEFELTHVGDLFGDRPGEHETANCYRLDYEGGACGFPPDHRLSRWVTQTPLS